MKVEHTEGRFFAKTEHGEAEVLYRVSGGTMSVYRSYTPEEDRGKGIAEQLMFAAFAFARENKLVIRPDCSYAKHFLEKHTELREYTEA